MPEVVVETVYDSEGNIIEQITKDVPQEELEINQVEVEVDEANDQALAAYQSWDNLTMAQKDRVLKALLGDYISRNRHRYTPSE